MRTNAPKIYAFSFFSMFLVMIPILVPFFLSRGLTMHQVFQLQALFGLSVAAMEVPTGYLCDLWGRKNTLIVGGVFLGIGFTLLHWANSFEMLFLHEFVLAIGFSLISGADISMLYDSMNAPEQGMRGLAHLQFYSVFGESVAALLGGALVVYGFDFPVMLNSITGWIPLLIALTLQEPDYEKMAKEDHSENFKKVLRHIFVGADDLLRWIFVNQVIWGLSTFFAVWMLQKYWEIQGIPLKHFGLLWAAFNFSVGVIGHQVHFFEKKWGARPLLVCLSIAPIVGYWGMGFFGGAIGVGFGFFFYLSRGITHVLLKDALNWRTPSAFRATANSLVSFFFRLGFAVLGPAVGWCIDHAGMTTALYALAGSLCVTFLVVMLPLLRKLKLSQLREIPY